MVTVADKRGAAQELVQRKLSTSEACRCVRLARSSFHYQPRLRPYEDWLRQQLRKQAFQKPAYGYRRQWFLLRQQGERVNHKRIHRLWKLEGLQLPRRRKRKRAVGPQGEIRKKPVFLNHVWSYDFVFDGLMDGVPLKILAVMDEYSRRCLALVAARSIRSSQVIVTLQHLVQEHGSPTCLRSDNGPEFVAERVRQWLQKQNVQTIFITPGSPWENAYMESFLDKLRSECLNREYFLSVTEANVILEIWRRDFNECRPHSSLGYLTPAAVAEINSSLTLSVVQKTGA